MTLLKNYSGWLVFVGLAICVYSALSPSGRGLSPYYNKSRSLWIQDSSPTNTDSHSGKVSLCIVIIVAFIAFFITVLHESYSASVYKLQVVFYGDHVRFIRRELDKNAKTFRSLATKKDIHRMMIDTLLLLSRQSDHILSIFSTVNRNSNVRDAMKMFRNLSFEEREKSKLGENNYLVVTILMTSNRTYKQLIMKDSNKLKLDLKSFACSIRVEDFLCMDVFWTPQPRQKITQDTLCEEKITQDTLYIEEQIIVDCPHRSERMLYKKRTYLMQPKYCLN